MRYLNNVVTLDLKQFACIGCGMCVDVCPHGVFEIQDRKAVLKDRDACMECGACKMNCPVNAIDVVPGVGCAYAIIMGKLKGTPPTCGCSDAENTGCCN